MWFDAGNASSNKKSPQLRKSHRLRLRVYRTASKLLDRLSDLNVGAILRQADFRLSVAAATGNIRVKDVPCPTVLATRILPL